MMRISLWATGACLVIATACGGAGKKTPTTTTEPRSSTTSTTLALPVEITPPSGPVGTTFTFKSAGFKAQEKVMFEIDLPNGAPFSGPAHPVSTDGSVKATYKVTDAKEVGTYHVRAVGDQGTLGEGQFEVSGASPTTSRAGTATTVRRTTATTVRRTTPTTVVSTTPTTSSTPTTAY